MQSASVPSPCRRQLNGDYLPRFRGSQTREKNTPARPRCMCVCVRSGVLATCSARVYRRVRRQAPLGALRLLQPGGFCLLLWYLILQGWPVVFRAFLRRSVRLAEALPEARSRTATSSARVFFTVICLLRKRSVVLQSCCKLTRTWVPVVIKWYRMFGVLRVESWSQRGPLVFRGLGALCWFLTHVR